MSSYRSIQEIKFIFMIIFAIDAGVSQRLIYQVVTFNNILDIKLVSGDCGFAAAPPHLKFRGNASEMRTSDAMRFRSEL